MRLATGHELTTRSATACPALLHWSAPVLGRSGLGGSPAQGFFQRTTAVNPAAPGDGRTPLRKGRPHHMAATQDSGRAPGRNRHSRRAFTILEMLVAAGILVVIMLGLLAMFYQTDRALRLGLQQRDILDAGRTAMEVMVRDLSMATAPHGAGTTNLFIFADVPAFEQPLDETGSGEVRTNTLQRFFLLTQDNDLLHGIRYDFVFEDENNDVVGTLHRMQITDMATNAAVVSAKLLDTDPDVAVNNDPLNEFNYGRIAEGVLHLTLRCYDADGYLIDDSSGPGPAYPTPHDNLYTYEFTGTNMPAYVELEFGVLEPRVFRLAAGMASPTDARNYLADKAGAVQLFRDRIPIRYTPPTTFSTKNF